jgi:sec-independent protein translocase protein TatA
LLQASSWLFGQALYLVAGCSACIFLANHFLTNKVFRFLISFDLKGARMFEGLFQPMHLLLVFGIALLVFGPKKLPELGKGIGEGIRGFKSAMKADEDKPLATATTVANDQSLMKE